MFIELTIANDRKEKILINIKNISFVIDDEGSTIISHEKGEKGEVEESYEEVKQKIKQAERGI